MKKLLAALSLIALVGCGANQTKPITAKQETKQEYQPASFAGWQTIRGDGWQFSLPTSFSKVDRPADNGSTYYDGTLFVHFLTEDTTADLTSYASAFAATTIHSGDISLLASRAGHMSGNSAALLVFNIQGTLVVYDFVAVDGKRAYHLMCTTAIINGAYDGGALASSFGIVKTVKF